MPCAGHARRADQQLRPVGLLERLHRRLARGRRVAAEQVRGVGEAREHRLLHLDVAGEDDERLAGLRGSRRSTPAPRASLPRAASRCSVPSCARRSARSVAAIFALSSRRSSGCVRSQAMTSSSASRYSRSLVERDRHDDLALGRQLRQHLGLQPAHEAAPAQVPVQALLRQLAAEACARTARPSRSRSRRPMTRSCETSSSAWLSTGVPLSASRSPSVDDRVGEPPHRLRALGLRVLDVVRLVDDERARPQPPERLAVRGDDLVVEDRDLAGRRRPRMRPSMTVTLAVRQPLRGLALPVELQRRGADDDRRERAVGLERRERLDGLAEPLLVGDERAPRVERVAHARPLKRRELAAEHRRDRRRSARR